MKLMRFLKDNLVGIGIIENTTVYDISKHLPSHSVETITNEWESIAGLDLSKLPKFSIEQAEQILPPVLGANKIICVGANSKTHNEEIGVGLKEPMFFFKPTSTLSGAYDVIPYSKMNKQVDWEGELAVIIGQSGKNIPEQRAMEHVFGYSCFNDLSDRYWQFKDGGDEIGGQASMAKCFDGFAPLGPWLVTKEDISDPNNLPMTLTVNGEVRQSFNSSDYIQNVAQCVSQLSHFMTLSPGDIIALGSGPGNAKHWQNQFLRPGDQVTFSIEGLGSQKQTVVEV
ncbi:fumarylacetoacetate hydrolase family protein [Vibrio sp. S4M6]|uniref:fumarylacetoacetate hydrolase family protein n=1 Tax=Vibrio sinus TaxID=2946865 RepID=UPI002029D1D6|nr:fumarylacetoacetate hydrolase family protein [Vibrio sinus]MCL9781256.1 fumarylacetoacetate hydrolase family protein [Vibrio sinus]